MKKFPKLHFGKAFLDELQKVSTPTAHFKKKFRQDREWQESLIGFIGGEGDETPATGIWVKVVCFIMLLSVFSVILMRLFHLQVFAGKYNRELADSNRIQIKVIHAQRGVIYDRNGKILAQNQPGFRLTQEIDGAKKTTYITRDEALKMEAEGDPRFASLEIDSNRFYSFGSQTAHILGYVGEITADELQQSEFDGYKIGDKTGRGGIEEAYEKYLRGTDGGEVIEVDASGKNLRVLRRAEAVAGRDVYLTIDADLQKIAFDQLTESVKKTGGCCAAVVGMNPQNGEVLTLVSLPAFDPRNINQFLSRENSPILNRVIGGIYPPGSTFKIASALAGLSSGKITPATVFEDTGVVYLGQFSFSNWYFTQYGKLEGGVDIARALERSNDTYFYHLGRIVGEQALERAALSLGLGKKTGIDIPGEVSGTVPSNEWKLDNIGDVWYPGDTLHMAIGQGYVLATPLQVLNLISTIAASGKQFPPHLVARIVDGQGAVIKQTSPAGTTVGFESNDIEVVRTGLLKVTKPGGTAWPFFSFPIPTAGKTGTAEFGDTDGRTHAWYASYAPEDNPILALSVLVEKGGDGSSVAAPVAKEIYRWYFSPDKNNLLKDVYPVINE